MYGLPMQRGARGSEAAAEAMRREATRRCRGNRPGWRAEWMRSTPLAVDCILLVVLLGTFVTFVLLSFPLALAAAVLSRSGHAFFRVHLLFWRGLLSGWSGQQVRPPVQRLTWQSFRAGGAASFAAAFLPVLDLLPDHRPSSVQFLARQLVRLDGAFSVDSSSPPVRFNGEWHAVFCGSIGGSSNLSSKPEETTTVVALGGCRSPLDFLLDHPGSLWSRACPSGFAAAREYGQMAPHREVFALLAAVHAARPASRVVVVGFGLGCSSALACALEHAATEWLTKVICFAPTMACMFDAPLVQALEFQARPDKAKLDAAVATSSKVESYLMADDLLSVGLSGVWHFPRPWGAVFTLPRSSNSNALHAHDAHRFVKRKRVSAGWTSRVLAAVALVALDVARLLGRLSCAVWAVPMLRVSWLGLLFEHAEILVRELRGRIVLWR